jgi:hypothetical protein
MLRDREKKIKAHTIKVLEKRKDSANSNAENPKKLDTKFAVSMMPGKHLGNVHRKQKKHRKKKR